MPDIEDSDIYSDSDTELSIFQGNTLLKVVRAVIRFYSNVGNFVRLRNGTMIAVHITEEGVYFVNIPEGV